MSTAKILTTSRLPRYVLSYYVPRTHTDAVNRAVFSSGAGSYPGAKYGEACFMIPGMGQFRLLVGAQPKIGTVGELEKVEEDKVEVVCVGEEVMREAVRCLNQSHPYEQVPYYVVKVEDV